MIMVEHDYSQFPELTNTQLQEYFLPPVHQLTEDFSAKVVKVHDGDTVTLRIPERDFDFPLRLLDIDAPELHQEHGHESRDWLRSWVEGREVEVKINFHNRVDKYGRLLGHLFVDGMNVNEILVIRGYATPFEARHEGVIPDNVLPLESGAAW